MGIIKNGRIRIWNAVKKQYEVVHPETEVARITDFADGIVRKLALTSAMTAVTALQSDSWFGKLLKMALTASGVKYSIAQNGYVCLGSLFGGLIIQWGETLIPASSKDREEIVVSFPITVNAVVNVQSSCKSPVGITRAGNETNSTLTIVRSGAWTAGVIAVDWQVTCK